MSLRVWTVPFNSSEFGMYHLNLPGALEGFGGLAVGLEGLERSCN